MGKNLPFFNWSISKLLLLEQDTFSRAKIKILFTFLIFAIFKACIVIVVAGYFNQTYQLFRALMMALIYLGLLKLLLSSTRYVKLISHAMIWVGVLLVGSNIIFFSQTVNIITLQFVFMLILGGFYLLETRYSLLCAVLCAVPIIIYVIFGEGIIINIPDMGGLASPGYEILIVLNFVTIVIYHYLFHAAFVENVEEKVALNLQLQIAVKEANAAAKAKTDFLSVMSHELRTPLNSVIGMTDLLIEETKDEDVSENLRILKFSAGCLHSVINNVLDFNKLESGKVKIEQISINICNLMNEIHSGFSYQAEEKGIDLILDIDTSICDLKVFTDPTRIIQILYNLLGNAIKFTANGAVFLSLKLVKEEKNKVFLKFSVIDSGIGIAEEKKAFIFEPFHQATASTTRHYGGTGLGLAIVKQLVNFLGGEINLESVYGEGANFNFELPFKIDKNIVSEKLSAKTEKTELENLKILIAEDNQMNRVLLSKVLSKWGCDLVFAENGLLAVEQFKTQVFDVILMDIYMPELDGYGATKQIRALENNAFPKLPIIAFTATVSDNLKIEIEQAGMDDYISKPFDAKDLYQKLLSLKIDKQNRVK